MPAVPILMYHSIAESSTPEFRDYVVPPGVFEAQIQALVESGWQTITMTALAQRLAAGQALPAQTVLLTFDDGFQDFAEAALPVLQRYGCTATLYVTTRFVGGRSRWLAPEGEAGRPMLSWSDLAHVQAAGVEIGAHSETHPQLDLLSPTVLARELTVPKVALEDSLGAPVTSLAYPFGYATARVRQMSAQLGYTNACIVGDLIADGSEDPFAVPRLTVTRELEPSELVARVGRPSKVADRLQSAARRASSLGLRRMGLKKPESAAISRAMR